MAAAANQLLPGTNGFAWYFPEMIPADQAHEYFESLKLTILWSSDRIKIFGKEIITRREVAWYGDGEFDYRYSGHSHIARPWTKELLEIKNLAELHCKTSFNSCLLNLYHNGSEGMGWHSDDESSLDPQAPIASVSLGAERRFLFRQKSDKTVKKEILLHNGSLLLMDAASQRSWQHSLPVSARISAPRINLTFRRMKIRES